MEQLSRVLPDDSLPDAVSLVSLADRSRWSSAGDEASGKEPQSSDHRFPSRHSCDIHVLGHANTKIVIIPFQGRAMRKYGGILITVNGGESIGGLRSLACILFSARLFICLDSWFMKLLIASNMA